ncbi:MAG: hypothetical protein ACYDA6_11370 [Solirubrobacteraceae bacterium]
MSPSGNDLSPTPKQLRYLRSLAAGTATSFVTPTTRRHASREIDRLRRLRNRGRAPSFDDVLDEQEPFTYATAVASTEVSGFGSAASWRRHSSAWSPPAPRPVHVGERTELARYSVSSGERVLYGQRINGCVRITDRPASGVGRSYLVERGLERDGYSALKALVTDYLGQARELDEVPMATTVVHFELEQIASAA